MPHSPSAMQPHRPPRVFVCRTVEHWGSAPKAKLHIGWSLWWNFAAPRDLPTLPPLSCFAQFESRRKQGTTQRMAGGSGELCQQLLHAQEHGEHEPKRCFTAAPIAHVISGLCHCCTTITWTLDTLWKWGGMSISHRASLQHKSNIETLLYRQFMICLYKYVIMYCKDTFWDTTCDILNHRDILKSFCNMPIQIIVDVFE